MRMDWKVDQVLSGEDSYHRNVIVLIIIHTIDLGRAQPQ